MPPFSSRFQPPWRRGGSLLLGLLLFGVACQPKSQPEDRSPTRRAQFEGSWQIIHPESSAIDPWNDLAVEIEFSADRLHLYRRWHGPTDYTAVDSIRAPIDGEPHEAPLGQWPDNRHIGAFARTDRPRRVAAEWLDEGRTLRVTSRFWVEVSQGERQIRTDTEYRMAPDGDRLIVLELRSTRPRARRYVLRRPPESGSNAP